MKKISFFNFIKDERQISFLYHESGYDNIEEGNIFFKFNTPNCPSDDAIALGLATIVAGFYDYIEFELSLRNNVFNYIKKYTKSTIKVKEVINCKYLPNHNGNIILNFSGGLDSLCAKFLLPPEKLKLVSVDFGERFLREKKFFSEFNPYIVETNVRALPFFKKLGSKNHHFMGIGTFLYFELLEASYYVFGTIFDALRNGLKNNFLLNVQNTPYDIFNLQRLYITEGLSEFSTAKIVSFFRPDLIKKALDSAAPVGSAKRYRKDLFVSISGYQADDFKISPPPPKKNVPLWGSKYPLDFISLYIYKKLGLKIANSITNNIPDDVIFTIELLSLDLYKKLHPNALELIKNNDIKKYFISKIIDADIALYNSRDFTEINILNELFKKFSI